MIGLARARSLGPVGLLPAAAFLSRLPKPLKCQRWLQPTGVKPRRGHAALRRRFPDAAGSLNVRRQGRFMKTKVHAIRLALVVEASSLLVFFIHSSRAVNDVLFGWFVLCNLPTVLLFRSYGYWRPLTVLTCLVMQSVVWFLIWYGLLRAVEKIKGRLKNRHDA